MTFQRIPAIGYLIWVFAGLLVLAGCATMDKNECLNADWQTIGFEDGAQGFPATRIASHRKACAKHGVAPDFNQYEMGRRKGLEQWCTPHNGYRLGTRGKRYNGVCPKNLEPAFVEALDRGLALHAYEGEVKKQEAELKKIYADVDDIDKRISDAEQALVSDDVSPRRRMKLLDEIRSLEDDRRFVLQDISELELTIEDMRGTLEQMRASTPYH